MKNRSKKMKVLIGIICAVSVLVVSMGVWQIVVRHQSKAYNLTVLDVSEVPEKWQGEPQEDTVSLSEVDMHYMVYGEGKKTLILIHGNGGSTESLKEAALYLANDYTVYLTDSRCHGKSSDPGEISYKLMAKDIYEFCHKMEIRKPYIMGHSDGGINALTIACEYPELPEAIISCGANSVPQTFKPYFTVGVKVMNLIKKDKLNDMMLTLPDFTEDDFGKIKCPVLIAAGEYDIMWLSDSVYIHQSIKDSEIKIIRSANHSSYISQDGKQAYALAKEYFDSLENT